MAFEHPLVEVVATMGQLTGSWVTLAGRWNTDIRECSVAHRSLPSVEVEMQVCTWIEVHGPKYFVALRGTRPKGKEE